MLRRGVWKEAEENLDQAAVMLLVMYWWEQMKGRITGDRFMDDYLLKQICGSHSSEWN